MIGRVRVSSLIVGIGLCLAAGFLPVTSQETRTYEYDLSHRLVRAVDGDGTVVDYVYDLAGNRLIRRVTPPGGPAGSPPDLPSNPGIADGATNVSTTPTLTWTGGDPDPGDTLVHSVLLGLPGALRPVYAGAATGFTTTPLLSYTTYQWQVESRDSRGATTSGPIWTFTTGNAPPVADFSAWNTSGWAPLMVAFTDASTGGGDGLAAWEWDFENDGIVDSTQRHPNHVYAESGTYSVALRVTDVYGATNTRARLALIAVNADADADGWLDMDDDCPAVFDPDQADADGDGLGDACDLDADNDGVVNADDNCDLDANANQADADADGFGDACTTNHCVTTSAELQATLTAAQANGRSDIIHLVQGTFGIGANAGQTFAYYSTDPHALVLRGGYEPGCGARLLDPGNTILDGEQLTRVAGLYSASTSPFAALVVEGVTVRNGRGETRAGLDMNAENGTVVIRRSVIASNQSRAETGGVGVLVRRGSVVLERSKILDNAATTRGGLWIECASADLLVTGSVIARNAASMYAGGLGLTMTGCRARLVNNTIVGNSADTSWGFGGGIYADVLDATASLDVHNTIAWGNTAAIGADININNFAAAPVNLSHNDLGDLAVDGTPATVADHIDSDPALLDAAGGDYHLLPVSPCIDAGDAAVPGIPLDDFEGDARVLGFAVDIGVDEFHAAGPAWAVRGRILEGGTGLAGIGVGLGGDRSALNFTGVDGSYRFGWLPPGHYVVTPMVGLHSFSPSQRAVVVVNADIEGVDFAASVIDDDGDGIADGLDNCPGLSNPDQADFDLDHVGDPCDLPGSISGEVTDAVTGLPIPGAFVVVLGAGSTATGPAGDYLVAGVANGLYDAVVWATGHLEQSRPTPITVLPGANTPGIDFALLPDRDSDFIGEPTDNCPDDSNYDQEDRDSDGLGDPCDPDVDGDGITNPDDNCVRDANAAQADADADGFGDVCTVVWCVATAADLQSALAEATWNTLNDVVQVVQGTYLITANGGGPFYHSSSEPYGVVLRGGYEPGCGARLLDPSNTVLDGEGLGQVLILSSLSGTPFAALVIEGLTIRNGLAWSGAGANLSMDKGRVAIRRAIIEENHAEYELGGLLVTVTGGQAILESTRVTGNSAPSFAGLRIDGTNADILLAGDLIADNTAAAGAGGGLGLRLSGGRVRLVNDTIAANAADPSTGQGGGVHLELLDAVAAAEVHNTILWGNSASSGADLHVSNTAGGSLHLFHSDIGEHAFEGGPPTFTACFDADPLFTNAASGNYHLLPGSVCVEAGNTTAPGIPATDFDGDLRVLGYSADVGADEYNVPGTTYSIGGRIVANGAGVAGVRLLLGGGPEAQRISDAGGFYRFTWLSPGSYAVTPVAGIYTFEPTQRIVSVTDVDVLGQDFVATQIDTDVDGDGVPDGADNCPDAVNPRQTDRDADGLGDACDCAPLDPADPPGPVGNTVMVSDPGGGAMIAWSDEGIPGQFAVYRGTRGALPGTGYDHSCFVYRTWSAAAWDAEEPPVGTGFYYLVSRIGCAESELGRNSAGNPIPNPAPCP